MGELEGRQRFVSHCEPCFVRSGMADAGKFCDMEHGPPLEAVRVKGAKMLLGLCALDNHSQIALHWEACLCMGPCSRQPSWEAAGTKIANCGNCFVAIPYTLCMSRSSGTTGTSILWDCVHAGKQVPPVVR